MDINRFSGIARPIILSERTNLLAILISLTTMGAATGILYHRSHLNFGEAALGGLNGGLAVFLCWALGRELDPDRPWSAFAGIVLLLIPYFWWFPQVEVILLLTLLLLLRLLNRSSGTASKSPDIFIILALNAWLLQQGHWTISLITIAAFWFNARLPEPQVWHRFVAVFIALAILLTLSLRPVIVPPGHLSHGVTILVIALSTAFAIHMRQLKEIKSKGDAGHTPLYLKRIRMAQLLALLMAVTYTLWNGNSALFSILPLWAALAGVGFWNMFTTRSLTPDKRSGTPRHHHHQ